MRALSLFICLLPATLNAKAVECRRPFGDAFYSITFQETPSGCDVSQSLVSCDGSQDNEIEVLGAQMHGNFDAEPLKCYKDDRPIDGPYTEFTLQLDESRGFFVSERRITPDMTTDSAIDKTRILASEMACAFSN